MKASTLSCGACHLSRWASHCCDGGSPLSLVVSNWSCIKAYTRTFELPPEPWSSNRSHVCSTWSRGVYPGVMEAHPCNLLLGSWMLSSLPWCLLDPLKLTFVTWSLIPKSLGLTLHTGAMELTITRWNLYRSREGSRRRRLAHLVAVWLILELGGSPEAFRTLWNC